MQRSTVINRKNALKVVKELDAFPKVPESYQETSATGGGLSIITFIVMAVLALSEVSYYSATDLEFDYEVDMNFSRKVKLNMDITVAMKCHHVGADVLDATGKDVLGYDQLKYVPTYWELSPKQKDYVHFVQQVNNYFQEDYHAIQQVLWREGNPTFFGGMPDRETSEPNGPPDACRVHGSLELDKVAGNFHITAGKSVPVIPRGHAHLAMMMDLEDYNFTHRIDHFSFGDTTPGVIYPLDGSEMFTSYNYHNFQYFMQVVPTEVRTYKAHMDTYQFAVTEKNRPINHATGSHGNPGIFVKYDLTPMMIRVTEVHKPYWQFLTRLCGIVGGVFCVSGMLNGLVHLLLDLVCCRLKLNSSKSKTYEDAVSSLPPTPVSQTSPLLAAEPPSDMFTRQLSNGSTVETVPLTQGVDMGIVPSTQTNGVALDTVPLTQTLEDSMETVPLT